MKPLIDHHHVLGFLCVDAAIPNVFDQSRDVPIGAGVADTLFHVLAPWIGDAHSAKHIS
jgi:hypothetical protein